MVIKGPQTKQTQFKKNQQECSNCIKIPFVSLNFHLLDSLIRWNCNTEEILNISVKLLG